MTERNIQNVIETKQVTLWDYEIIRFRAGNIYCPMCQDVHENNSNCQRND